MNIYVLRHGLTELNKKGIINGHFDDSLSVEGVKQAQAVKQILPPTIKYIYSSPLQRARETTEILNEDLQLPVIFRDELKEVNFGVLNGTPFLDEYKEKHISQQYDWRPSGESFEDVKVRVLKLLQEIKSNTYEDGEVLLVSHGGIIRLMYFLESGKFFDSIENASLWSFDLNQIIK